MAYVDGELGPDESRAFEGRLAAEPHLAREVSGLRALELVARQAAPPEPMDYEWARLERDPIHQAGHQGGLAMILIGTVGLFVWIGVTFAMEEGPLLVKLTVGAIVAGLVMLFLAVLRGRLRTYRFDPYTKVKR